jgi:predicted RNase H-like nuclease (RuvC/YqgF family)
VETDFQNMGAIVGGGAASFVGIGWLARALIRRIAKDWREVQIEGAGVDAVDAWKEEAKMQRERADRAYHERNEAIAELGTQRERVAQLTAQIDALKRIIEALEGRVERLQTRLEAALERSGRYPALDPDAEI